jgi:hypothetical protein
MAHVTGDNEIVVEQIDSPTRRRIEERYSRLTMEDKREILVNTIDQMLDHLEREQADKETQSVTTPKTKRKVKITSNK